MFTSQEKKNLTSDAFYILTVLENARIFPLMNDAPRTAKPTRAPSPFAVRVRARRIEDERIEDRAYREAARVCDCGIGLKGSSGRCAACETAHKKAVRGAFGGL